MAGRKKKAKPANVKTSTMPETITIESTSAGEVSRCEDVTPPTQEKLEEQDKDVACSDSSDDFQSSASNVKQQNKRLLSEIKTLQEKVAMLENERDFLRTTLTTAMASTGKVKANQRRSKMKYHLVLLTLRLDHLRHVQFYHLHLPMMSRRRRKRGRQRRRRIIPSPRQEHRHQMMSCKDT
ncbi:hypothetical protein AALO_G00146980 [Alosa alosa]|uniref:Uncharacterized protein n=1 Tax=Alosa alosa TaxID=278164 RepID=A0AAV6GD63_9TELE|nr:uncharacterized protein LOC125302895 isoform X2 [Alosa alosa]KAG5273044.1 hypothetical protein AALO_G00146980 [Alosa alosa]